MEIIGHILSTICWPCHQKNNVCINSGLDLFIWKWRGGGFKGDTEHCLKLSLHFRSGPQRKKWNYCFSSIQSTLFWQRHAEPEIWALSRNQLVVSPSELQSQIPVWEVILSFMIGHESSLMCLLCMMMNMPVEQIHCISVPGNSTREMQHRETGDLVRL